MELYIHFGIYKAGSSYLQYVLANSMEYLESNGIYFPGSSNDSKMLQGKISPGNADGLEEALVRRDVRGIKRILENWSMQAKDRNCDKVLVSSEALVHQLSRKKELELLLDQTKNAKYERIHAMGFFRDLVDHAISTYKHRAKSGKIPDYEHWVKEVYETPNLLTSLCKRRAEKFQIVWTFRKFYKNSNALKKAFFKDWLHIEVSDFSGKPAVNESVTISEVLVMNEVNKLYPSVTDYFVNKLKNLASKEKAGDPELEEYFSTVFSDHLAMHQVLIDRFNGFLPDGEELRVTRESFTKHDIKDIEPAIQLNSKQLSIILDRMVYFGSERGKIIRMRRKMLSFLPEGLRKVISKRNKLK